MSVRQITPSIVSLFRQELTEVVDAALQGEMSPASFSVLLAGLKSVFASVGRRVLIDIVGTHEVYESVIEHGGQQHRFKQVSTKEWLTPFGLIQVDRRYFQRDAGGDGVAPIDLLCGMSGRYMTPDIEEVTAFASADLNPTATRGLMAKLLPQAPSEKAIRRVIADVGAWGDDAWDEIEYRVAEKAPLPEGDTLVVSVDGVIVPMRGEGVKLGRPAERPGVREDDSAKTVWREAGVGTISTYMAGDGADVKPERLRTRYFARMPEAAMETLFARQSWAALELTHEQHFDNIVVICDGKLSLWKTIEADPLYSKATQILDFYHAAEHLSSAAEAIFGKKEERATRWYKKYRALLKEDSGGLESLLRSLRYYRKGLRAGSDRFKLVGRVIGYFGRNRERMRYAEFRDRGLPIGSGVVEAACKTIVGTRLKRSGMRWSEEGGQHVLNLRTRARSGEWDCFWGSYQELRSAA